MARQLAITKTLKLDTIKGWDDQAYLAMTPVTIGELSSLTGIEKKTEAEALDVIVGLLKSHFAHGKVYILNGTEQELVDAEKDDVASLPTEVITSLFETLTGGDLADPKDEASTQTAKSTGEASSSESTTETQ